MLALERCLRRQCVLLIVIFRCYTCQVCDIESEYACSTSTNPSSSFTMNGYTIFLSGTKCSEDVFHLCDADCDCTLELVENVIGLTKHGVHFICARGSLIQVGECKRGIRNIRGKARHCSFNNTEYICWRDNTTTTIIHSSTSSISHLPTVIVSTTGSTTGNKVSSQHTTEYDVSSGAFTTQMPRITTIAGSSGQTNVIPGHGSSYTSTVPAITDKVLTSEPEDTTSGTTSRVTSSSNVWPTSTPKLAESTGDQVIIEINTMIPVTKGETSTNQGDITKLSNMIEELDFEDEDELLNNLDYINNVVKKLTISAGASTTYISNMLEILVLNEFPVKTLNKKVLFNFSKSEVKFVELTDHLSEAAYVSIMQLNAPMFGLKKLMENETTSSSSNPKKTTNIISESTPLLAITAYEGTNHTEIKARVSFTIDVSKDALRQPELHDDTKLIENMTYVCAFLNTTTRRISTYGCHAIIYVTGSNVTCECNHTTTFAVLISVTTVSIPSGVKTCSYVTEALSVLALLATCFILHNVQNQIRSDRIVVQISLSVSLICFHVLNLLHDAARLNGNVCEYMTVFTHYFLLTSGMWMLMEGITIALKTTHFVMRYNELERKFFITRHAVSWGVPAVIVIISVIYGFRTGTYMKETAIYNDYNTRNATQENPFKKYNYCWINSSILIPSVVIPMSVIFFVNILVILRMAYVIYRMRSNVDNFKPSSQRGGTGARTKMSAKISTIKSSLTFSVLFLPVLGIPWILGFFVGLEDRTASVRFMYINATLNGLQGVFLFFIYCIVGTDVRVAMMRNWNRNKILGSSPNYVGSTNLKNSKTASTRAMLSRPTKSQKVESMRSTRSITSEVREESNKTSRV